MYLLPKIKEHELKRWKSRKRNILYIGFIGISFAIIINIFFLIQYQGVGPITGNDVYYLIGGVLVFVILGVILLVIFLYSLIKLPEGAIINLTTNNKKYYEFKKTVVDIMENTLHEMKFDFNKPYSNDPYFIDGGIRIYKTKTPIELELSFVLLSEPRTYGGGFTAKLSIRPVNSINEHIVLNMIQKITSELRRYDI